jgi:hypothetical protein
MKKQNCFHHFRLICISIYYLLVIFPIVVSASEVTLQWSVGEPAPEGYNLYVRDSSASFDYSTPMWSGDDSQFKLTGLTPGETYFFVVRAFNGDQESTNSNEVQYTVPVSCPPEESDLDSDHDGIPDGVDAFPDELSESFDTDSDGIGDNEDEDDDGDGMPDEWEALHEGLDPLRNDAQSDLDGDGISNLDEFTDNSDPANYPGNTPPQIPNLVEPEDEALVDLTPTLYVDGFVDADGDIHGRTQYQIATEMLFDDESIVWNRTCPFSLTTKTVGDLILDADTTYFWRVRFIDDHNGASQWSPTRSFTTESFEESGDMNADGVLDAQAVDHLTDMDNNGVADVNQDGILSVSSPDIFNPQLAVKRNSDNIHVVAAKAYRSDGLGLTDNQPQGMTGLIGFKIHLDPGVSAASVTVYFSEAAHDDAQWFKYDPEHGWSEYTHATFSEDRRSVTLAIKDGGIGDQDGIKNGVIVDPAGLGYRSVGGSDDSATILGMNVAVCFIGQAVEDFNGDKIKYYLSGFMMLLIGLFVGLMGTLRFQRRPY